MKKTYQKSKHELELLRVLADMEAKGIRTLKDLQREENAGIYTALWFAMEKFVNYVALQTKTCKTADNKYSDGNAPRLRELLEMGADPEDLRSSILLRIMEKMTLVLDRPVSAQIPYCVTICTNCLVNEYRRLCPDGKQILSLNKPIGNKEEDDYTLEEIAAAADNAEDWVMAFETARERAEAERKRRQQERLEHQKLLRAEREQSRRELLEDLPQLRSGNQAFVYLCMYEQMKPARIYAAVEQLTAKGYTPQEIAEITVEKICKKYAICRTRETAVLDKPLTRSMVKHLSTLDREIITNKISDVKYELPEGVKLRLQERRQTAALKR